jgi:hypothetical protein
MTDTAKISLSPRASARPLQWLLTGALLTLTLPTFATDAVGPVKKASTTSDAKVVPIVKPTPHKVTREEEREVKLLNTPTPPKKDLDKELIKSSNQVKKSKVKSATDKQPVLVDGAATQK